MVSTLLLCRCILLSVTQSADSLSAEVPITEVAPQPLTASTAMEYDTPSPGTSSAHHITSGSTPSSSRKRHRVSSSPYSALPFSLTAQSTNGKPTRRSRKPRDSALPSPFQYSVRDFSSPQHYGRREASRAGPTQHNYTRRVPSRTSFERASALLH